MIESEGGSGACERGGEGNGNGENVPLQKDLPTGFAG